MGQFGLGQAVERTEDQRFVTGQGRYTDDINRADQAYGYVLRSPHAHARITRFVADSAAAAPGILLILTAADLLADGVQPIPCMAPITSRDGSPGKFPPRPCLAGDRVRHVGDQIAFIVAESAEAARNAAELIEIEFEPLPSVTDTGSAASPGQPLVWDDIERNQCFDWEMGDPGGVDAAFAKAAHISRIDLVNNRVVVASMETRNAIGSFADGRFTLQTGTQGGHMLKGLLAPILGVDKAAIRVITPDVGGGFGMKLFLYPEYLLVLAASKRLGRPVKWSCDRADAFLSDTQGRDHVTHAELALDESGGFLAWRFDITANLGAYLSNFAPFIPTAAGSAMLSGVYTTPSIYVRVKGVFTNTVPVDAYRGAGRPEATYVVERLLDKAARELGIPPDMLRRRNFIRPEQMPFHTALGLVYDSGDFQKNLDDALAIIDYAGFPARKAASAAQGRLRGLGFATYIEKCGGGEDESAELRLDADGSATLRIGTQSTGQGHETAYAQLIAEELGLPLDRITIIQGDTDAVKTGRGTGGSRSLPVGGVSTKRAVEQVITQLRSAASHQLEAAETDLIWENGQFTIAGTDRSLDWPQIIRQGAAGDLPADMPRVFSGTGRWKPPAGTFPNGCHAVELEIDPDTGATTILRYVVVDDFGTVVNPALLAGQVHGGIMQGVGQALCEAAIYDPETGQLLTGSFMDYAMPRASDLPPIEFSYNIVPCTTNPLGIKGAGEAGAIGAPPAVINAVVDALSPYGVPHIDMPATPHRIWNAIQQA